MSQPSHQQLVAEFHDTFGHPIREELYENCWDTALPRFRISLIEEEYKEAAEAIKNNDWVEFADGLGDCLYVVIGFALTIGYDLDKGLAERNATELHLDQVQRVTANRENFPSLADAAMQRLRATIDHIIIAVDNRSIGDLTQRLLDCMMVLYQSAHSVGMPIDSMFREIHRSNMTKVCDSMESALQSVELYRQDGRYAEPTIREKGKWFVVYDAKTSKILKNHAYSVASLAQFFE